MSKLFMVYLGGQAPGSNIEVHDVRFVVGETIEATFGDLRSQWFGLPEGLHMDCYAHIESVDGYRIELSDAPVSSDLQLYFVNLGGYHPDVLGELHQDGLFVAESSAKAKAKALHTMLDGAEEKHKDNMIAVDQCLQLSSIGNQYIHLTKIDQSKPLKPDWYGYHRIDIQS